MDALIEIVELETKKAFIDRMLADYGSRVRSGVNLAGDVNYKRLAKASRKLKRKIEKVLNETEKSN